MRILITGGKGQLATELAQALAAYDVTALPRSGLDITVPDQVEAIITNWRPAVVVNTAAFHHVDRCETEPEASFAVNAAAPQRLAALCAAHQSLLVHISTDYVFSGAKGAPYAEWDEIDPINVYGTSKAAGEMAIRCTTDRHLIVRTTGLYGHAGRTSSRGNFVETILRLAGESNPLSIVDDQVMTPSSARDVAGVIAELIRRDVRGTFHMTNSGECSWYEFAAEILRLIGQPMALSRISQADRPLPARRPPYSVLAHERLREAGLPSPQPWQAALSQYLAERALDDPAPRQRRVSSPTREPYSR